MIRKSSFSGLFSLFKLLSCKQNDQQLKERQTSNKFAIFLKSGTSIVELGAEDSSLFSTMFSSAVSSNPTTTIAATTTATEYC